MRGHYAAACVAAYEKRGKTVEVSWADVGDMDRRELMGREVDLIAPIGSVSAPGMPVPWRGGT